MTIFGDCVKRGYNLRCEPGYWLDKANDKCQKVDVSCDFYYSDTGKCFNCSTGYKMENGECVQGVTCNSQQFFSAGRCIDVPLSCIDFAPTNGLCFKCDRGYTLKDGFCSGSISQIINDCIHPCKTCLKHQKGFCFSCNLGYHLRDGKYGSCMSFPY